MKADTMPRMATEPLVWRETDFGYEADAGTRRVYVTRNGRALNLWRLALS